MARDRPRRVADDDRGQMMILTAVILLIGFIALAGMVSRVSQLSSQTAIESERIILREIGPLADSMNSAICKLKDSTVTGFTLAPAPATTVGNTGGFATIQTSSDFALANIGMVVRGPNIVPGSRVVAVDGNVATLNTAPSSTGAVSNIQLTPCTTSSFALVGSELETSVVNVLEHLQALQAAHGLFMGWRIDCGNSDPGPATPEDSQVVAHLWDGTVWVEVRSSVPFTRTTPCAAPLEAPLFPLTG